MNAHQDNKKLGEHGENVALDALTAIGCELLERNFRAERCEIDLIVRDAGTVVFVEVKARHAGSFGRGREAVDKRKQRNIIKAAEAYAVLHGLMEAPMRFDVIEVDLGSDSIVHIKNAFTL